MNYNRMIILIVACIFIFSGCSSAEQDDVHIEKEKNQTEELNLDNKSKRKINVFISNFAECNFKNFDIENTDDKELITFAVNHNYINNWNLFYTDSGWAKIHENNIEKTICKYFDKDKIKHQSISDMYTNIKYDKKHYACPFEDKKNKAFAQITRIEKKDDKYTAYANIYSDIQDCVGDPYEPIDYSKDRPLYINKKVEVVFKEIIENNNKRYILLKYNELGDEKLLDFVVNINNDISIDEHLWLSEDDCCCGGNVLRENRNHDKSKVVLSYIRNDKLQSIDLIDYILKYNLSEGIESVSISPDQTYVVVQFRAECEEGNISFLINIKNKNVNTLWDNKKEQISMYNISFKDNDTFYYLVPGEDDTVKVKKYTISKNKSQTISKINSYFRYGYLIKFNENHIVLANKYNDDLFKINYK